MRMYVLFGTLRASGFRVQCCMALGFYVLGFESCGVSGSSSERTHARTQTPAHAHVYTHAHVHAHAHMQHNCTRVCVLVHTHANACAHTHTDTRPHGTGTCMRRCTTRHESPTGRGPTASKASEA